MKWSTSSGSPSRRRSPPVNGSCERVGGRAAGAASGTTPAWATASLAASRLRSRLDPLARAMARHPDRRTRRFGLLHLAQRVCLYIEHVALHVARSRGTKLSHRLAHPLGLTGPEVAVGVSDHHHAVGSYAPRRLQRAKHVLGHDGARVAQHVSVAQLEPKKGERI